MLSFWIFNALTVIMKKYELQLQPFFRFQLLPKTFANKPLLPPPPGRPRFVGERSATTTSAAANKENQEDQEMVVPLPPRTGADHVAESGKKFGIKLFLPAAKLHGHAEL